MVGDVLDGELATVLAHHLQGKSPAVGGHRHDRRFDHLPARHVQLRLSLCVGAVFGLADVDTQRGTAQIALVHLTGHFCSQLIVRVKLRRGQHPVSFDPHIDPPAYDVFAVVVVQHHRVGPEAVEDRPVIVQVKPVGGQDRLIRQHKCFAHLLQLLCKGAQSVSPGQNLC